MHLSVLLLLVAYLAGTHALYFYLEGSEKKCFIEDLPKETMVIGKVSTFCFFIYFILKLPLDIIRCLQVRTILCCSKRMDWKQGIKNWNYCRGSFSFSTPSSSAKPFTCRNFLKVIKSLKPRESPQVVLLSHLPNLAIIPSVFPPPQTVGLIALEL